MSNKYWDDDPGAFHHAQLDLESMIALRMIEHWGMVAGKHSDEEDSGGRKYLALQTPEELVARAFIVAGLFIAEAEKRDGIKPLPSLKERAIIHGEAEHARMEAHYPSRHRETGPQVVEDDKSEKQSTG